MTEQTLASPPQADSMTEQTFASPPQAGVSSTGVTTSDGRGRGEQELSAGRPGFHRRQQPLLELTVTGKEVQGPSIQLEGAL